VGINWKGYKRGANSALLASAEAFSPDERKHLQAWMDEIYDVFKGHVTAARGARLKKPLDDMAGGRVYTGEQALALGLIDKIGSLQDAVKFAAAEAKVEKYDTRVVPEPKNFIEVLMEGMSGDNDENAQRLSVARPGSLSQASDIFELALPYLSTLDRERSQAFGRLLVQLETLRRENVAVMMPELLIRAK
jgi:protease-4